MAVEALLAGVLLSLSLAAPPGPANALMAQETARRGFSSGWLTGLGAVTGDLTMLALTAFGVLKLLAYAPWLQVALAYVGAALMAKFALDAWKAGRASHMPEASGRGGFVRNYVIVMTSPFNFAWWLTGGTTLLTSFGGWGAIGFFAGLLVWVTVWNGLAVAGARRIDRFAHHVAFASAAVLVFFAGFVAWFAVTGTLDLLG